MVKAVKYKTIVNLAISPPLLKSMMYCRFYSSLPGR